MFLDSYLFGEKKHLSTRVSFRRRGKKEKKRILSTEEITLIKHITETKALLYYQCLFLMKVDRIRCFETDVLLHGSTHPPHTHTQVSEVQLYQR